MKRLPDVGVFSLVDSPVVGAAVTSSLSLELLEYSDAGGETDIASSAPGQGAYVWARVPQSGAAPAPDGVGNWTGAPLQTGASPAPAPGDIADIATSGTNGVQYDLYLYQRVGTADSNVISFTYTEDRQAPTLSDVRGIVGDTAAQLAYATDEDNGTVRWVLTPSASVPGRAQITNGEDHTGATATDAGVATVTASGAQANLTSSGLENGTTYHFHLFHEDARGNVSTIRSASVVPDAGGLALSYLGQDVSPSGGASYTFSDKPLGTGTIFVAVVVDGNTVSDVTVDGVAASLVTDGSTNGAVASGGNSISFWQANSTAASGDIVATMDAAASGASVYWWRVNGASFIEDVSVAQNFNLAEPWTLSANVNTIADGFVLMAGYALWSGAGGDYDNTTGVTQRGNSQIVSAGSYSDFGGDHSVTAAQTPRTVSIGDDTTAPFRAYIVSVSIRP